MIDKTVIAITGKKRSGKDSAGDYLRRFGYLPAQKLAQPIKDIAMLMFGWSHAMVEGIDYDREQVIPELGISVRQFLQECGSLFKYDLSEKVPLYKEQQGTKVWAKILTRWLAERQHDKFYLTDVRFPEEVEELRDNISRVVVVRLISDRTPWDPHISEVAVDEIQPDFTIVNNGYNSYPILYAGLNNVIASIKE